MKATDDGLTPHESETVSQLRALLEQTRKPGCWTMTMWESRQKCIHRENRAPFGMSRRTGQNPGSRRLERQAAPGHRRLII